ncbi:uncharacterized protein [Euwallacea similis]|uniref:uncharacterized protein n=1 Tax=Euwallacea similis TaxID=1736056 RepID=UPI00344F6D65
MSQETETVNGAPETPQPEEAQKRGSEEHQVSSSSDQPIVQEDACILKSPKSPVSEATESFLENEKAAYESEQAPEVVLQTVPASEPDSTFKVNNQPDENEQTSEVAPPQVVEVSLYSESMEVDSSEPAKELSNGHAVEQEKPVRNGNSHIEAELEPPQNNVNKALNGTIASELVAEDYKLPDVVEVKKNFEISEPLAQNAVSAPPRKGALSTNLDERSVKQAYQDVRHDGSETQWAVFKFEGPTIVTSAIGTDFGEFRTQFGDDERAFGYIRVQTGDELSKRAKFLLVTWVGPQVSVLKRAKMSTDKALIKDILSNFAVELQTENIGDINLPNFEAVLDRAAGAHYGTGIRS